MSYRRLLPGLLLLVLFAGPAVGGDVAAGKAKSTACSGCHGPDGNSTSQRWPKLAGQHEAYLIKQMVAFKAGERHDPIMKAIMQAFSDTDIANLAAYFAAQQGR